MTGANERRRPFWGSSRPSGFIPLTERWVLSGPVEETRQALTETSASGRSRRHDSSASERVLDPPLNRHPRSVVSTLMPRVLLSCEGCGHELEHGWPSAIREQVYCSQSCRTIARKTTCARDACAVEFVPRKCELAKGRGQYCSVRCAAQATQAARGGMASSHLHVQSATARTTGRLQDFHAASTARGRVLPPREPEGPHA